MLKRVAIAAAILNVLAQITGIEIYKSPAEMPKEFARRTWGKERCWMVAYWTYDFRYKPIRQVAPGKPPDV